MGKGLMRKYVLAKRVTTAFMVIGLWLLLPALGIYFLAPGEFDGAGHHYGHVAMLIGSVLLVLGLIMRLGVWQNSRTASR